MKLRLSLALLVILPLAGCAAWRERLPSGDVAPEREARKADVVQAFEQQRDAAQLEAALDRWEAGDVAGCENRLRGLLARHPDNADVRLRLGELLWTRGAAAEAENELRQVISAQPERAEAHHLLSLLLAEQDRTGEARSHLAKAAELAPQAEEYRLAIEALPAIR